VQGQYNQFHTNRHWQTGKSVNVSSTEDTSTIATISYQAASAKSSLYRNGEVLIRRDQDGSDDHYKGPPREEREVTIRNARLLDHNQRRTIQVHGFELLTRPLSNSYVDFYDHQQVTQNYYTECAEIVRVETGGSEVFAFDHNIRSATGKKNRQRIIGGQQVQGPARTVHGDYTLTSGPQRLRDLAKPPSANDTLRSILGESTPLLKHDMVDQVLDTKGRFAIINVWRNIADEPVANHPLALCDGQSVSPEDLVVFEIHYHDRVGENYFAKHADQHSWWYYPAMTRDEVLLIKQWDSIGELAQSDGARADSSAGGEQAPCTFSFHTSFKDLTIPPEAPDRQSIEVRCIVLYN